MENATKALLIAAAVLVAIVLIGLGVSIAKNASQTGQQGQEVGQIMEQATDSAIRRYQKMYITSDEFNDFLVDFKNKYGNSYEVIDAIRAQNSKVRNQIEITCYSYQDIASQWSKEPGYKSKKGDPFSSKWIVYQNYMTYTFIPSLVSSGRLKTVPLSSEEGLMMPIMKDLYEVYKRNKDESASYETFVANTKVLVLYHYGIDSDGYVSKVCMIGRIKSW